MPDGKDVPKEGGRTLHYSARWVSEMVVGPWAGGYSASSACKSGIEPPAGSASLIMSPFLRHHAL